jgi:hypothetical protein
MIACQNNRLRDFSNFFIGQYTRAGHTVLDYDNTAARERMIRQETGNH